MNPDIDWTARKLTFDIKKYSKERKSIHRATAHPKDDDFEDDTRSKDEKRDSPDHPDKPQEVPRPSSPESHRSESDNEDGDAVKPTFKKKPLPPRRTVKPKTFKPKETPLPPSPPEEEEVEIVQPEGDETEVIFEEQKEPPQPPSQPQLNRRGLLKVVHKKEPPPPQSTPEKKEEQGVIRKYAPYVIVVGASLLSGVLGSKRAAEAASRSVSRR